MTPTGTNPYQAGKFPQHSSRADFGRISRALGAFAVGWTIYMIAVITTAYAGGLSLVFQPIVAAVVSAIVVGIALLLGLVLRVPALGRVWHTNALWATGLAALSLLVMIGGRAVGISAEFIDPETGWRFVGLHPAAALGSYATLLFALANWPIGWNVRPAGGPLGD